MKTRKEGYCNPCICGAKPLMGVITHSERCRFHEEMRLRQERSKSHIARVAVEQLKKLFSDSDLALHFGGVK